MVRGNLLRKKKKKGSELSGWVSAEEMNPEKFQARKKIVNENTEKLKQVFPKVDPLMFSLQLMQDKTAIDEFISASKALKKQGINVTELGDELPMFANRLLSKAKRDSSVSLVNEMEKRFESKVKQPVKPRVVAVSEESDAYHRKFEKERVRRWHDKYMNEPMGRKDRILFSIIKSKRESSLTQSEMKVLTHIEGKKGVIEPNILAKELGISVSPVRSAVAKLKILEHPYASVKLYDDSRGIYRGSKSKTYKTKKQKVNALTDEERAAKRRAFKGESLSYDIELKIRMGYSDEEIMNELVKRRRSNTARVVRNKGKGLRITTDFEKSMSDIKKIRQKLSEEGKI